MPTRVRRQRGETRRAWKNSALPHRRRVQLLVDDLGDRHCILPLLAGARDRRHRAAADEGELAALEHHAAIAGRETAGLGAVGDDVTDGQLAGQRLSLFDFEIDAAGEAFELAAARIGAAQVGDGSARVTRRLDGFVRLRPTLFAVGRGDSGIRQLRQRAGGITSIAVGSRAFGRSAAPAAGRTWAGATEEAAERSDDQMAERKVHEHENRYCAVNRPVGG